MATVKFLNAAGKYDDPAARDDVIRYITQKCKTPSGYIGTSGVDLPYAARQMQAVAESFKKDTKVWVRHFVVSFYRNAAIDPYKANLIASMIAGEIGRLFQCVYAVHEDTYHLHFHIVFKTVIHVNGYKYSGTKEEHKDLRNLIGKYVRAMGIQIFYEVKYNPEPNNLYE